MQGRAFAFPLPSSLARLCQLQPALSHGAGGGRRNHGGGLKRQTALQTFSIHPTTTARKFEWLLHVTTSSGQPWIQSELFSRKSTMWKSTKQKSVL
eukprot:g760.t1